MRVGSTMTVKLFRDLWRLRSQAVAIALVIAAGVGTMIMAVGLISSLAATRDSYYDQTRFADIFAPLVRAPETLMAKVRLLPGVIGKEESLAEESFEWGLLEYPHYTRPQVWDGRTVPEVLLSGHHEKIRAWRKRQAEDITRQRRPDLWDRYVAAKNVSEG